jgi:uncharacterized caspase-like protein
MKTRCYTILLVGCPTVLTVLLALGPISPAALAQSDSCNGALNALNRVKEEISPKLSAETPTGKTKLQVMASTLERGTRVCRDFGELWFYRMVVAHRLGVEKDAAYAKTKADDLGYTAEFDPFSLPPSATPPSPSQSPTPGQPRGQTPGTAPSPTPGKVRQKWALVVGIDSFNDKRIPTLHFSVKDSSDFVDYLKDPKGGQFDPAHIIHLANDKATLEGIREGLGRLRVDAQPDDLVVVYLSSHGSPRDIDPNGVSYVVVHDTNLDDAATLYATSLQMIDLVQQINREVKARRVVLILDTCFSGDALTSLEAGSGGTASRGFSAPVPLDKSAEATSPPAFSAAFQNLTIGYGRAVITASRASQESWESAKLRNGYFTHYLLDVLRTSHGSEPLDQLFPQVRTLVSTHVKAEVGASQDPSYEFSEGADSIVLGAPKSM